MSVFVHAWAWIMLTCFSPVHYLQHKNLTLSALFGWSLLSQQKYFVCWFVVVFLLLSFWENWVREWFKRNRHSPRQKIKCYFAKDIDISLRLSKMEEEVVPERWITDVISQLILRLKVFLELPRSRAFQGFRESICGYSCDRNSPGNVRSPCSNNVSSTGRRLGSNVDAFRVEAGGHGALKSVEVAG